MWRAVPRDQAMIEVTVGTEKRGGGGGVVRFYALSASEAGPVGIWIFRARTYSHNLFSPGMI